MRCGRISGEENRERGNEEKREHGRDEDPEREEATKTRSTSGSSRSNRHWILNLVRNRVRSKDLKNLNMCKCVKLELNN